MDNDDVASLVHLLMRRMNRVQLFATCDPQSDLRNVNIKSSCPDGIPLLSKSSPAKTLSSFRTINYTAKQDRMHLPTVITAALAAAVLAHPGHDHDAEQAVRREALQFSKRDLSHCAAKIKARGLEARSIKRRSTIANNLLKKRNLKSESHS